MRAGKLPHFVTIERPVTTNDDFGQAVESWETLAEVWASVEGLSGRELLQAQQVQSEASKRVRVRGPGLEDLDEKCRVAWSGGTLLVEAIIDKDGRRIELELLCKETK